MFFKAYLPTNYIYNVLVLSSMMKSMRICHWKRNALPEGLVSTMNGSWKTVNFSDAPTTTTHHTDIIKQYHEGNNHPQV